MTTAKKPSKPTGPSKAKPRPGPNKQKRGSSAVGERLVHTQKVGRSTRPPASTKVKPTRPDVKVFIAEYLRDSNGRRAAIAAGYSEKTADSQASRLLKSVKVRAEVDRHQAQIIQKVQHDTGITLERTLREIARGAFYDPRRFFDDKGELRRVTDLDDDTASALAGFEVTEEFQGRGDERELAGYTKKVKLADRKGYLDMLMKHLGGYKVDNDQKKSDPAEVVAAFVRELHQSGDARLPMSPPRNTR